MGIREFGSWLFFVAFSMQLQAATVKNHAGNVRDYLKAILIQQKEISTKGLLEKVDANSQRSFARYEMSFDGINVHINYVPFDREESYKLFFVKGNLSAQNSKKQVVMSYSPSQAHLFSFIDRAFKEIRGEEKGIDSLFDVMNWKFETKKNKTTISAVANRDFPVQIFRLEFDENKKLQMMAFEMKNREAYALWSDK